MMETDTVTLKGILNDWSLPDTDGVILAIFASWIWKHSKLTKILQVLNKSFCHNICIYIKPFFMYFLWFRLYANLTNKYTLGVRVVLKSIWNTSWMSRRKFRVSSQLNVLDIGKEGPWKVHIGRPELEKKPRNLLAVRWPWELNSYMYVYFFS